MPTIDSLRQSLITCSASYLCFSQQYDVQKLLANKLPRVTKKDKRRYEGEVNYMCSFGMLPYLNNARWKLIPGLFGIMLQGGGYSQSITEALHTVRLCQAYPTVLRNRTTVIRNRPTVTRNRLTVIWNRPIVIRNVEQVDKQTVTRIDTWLMSIKHGAKSAYDLTS